MKKAFCILSFLLLCLSASAQLHIGVFGNAHKNFPFYDKGYYGNFDGCSNDVQKKFKEKFYNQIAGGVYLSSRYDLNSWLAVRTDLDCQILTTREVRDVVSKGIVGYTKIPTLLLPVMGCAYLRKGSWDFYECPGLYSAYAIDNRIAYKNWDFGFVNCIGIGHRYSTDWSFNCEVKYYRGFLNQHETGSKYFKQPIYHQFVELAAGISYTIDLKKK